MELSTRDSTATGWRALGFWYDYTPKDGWIIRGSRNGLLSFVRLLCAYAENSKRATISEHDHLGPFMYLKLATWNSAEVNSDGIYGTQADIRNLAKLLEDFVSGANQGDVRDLAPLFSAASTANLLVNLESDSFDPAAYDQLGK